MSPETASGWPVPDWLNTEALSSMGFNYIMQMGGSCPFQMELGHESSIYLYFRSINDTAEIEVYNVDPIKMSWDAGLPDDDYSIGFASAQYWLTNCGDAGWLEPDEALYILHSLWSDLKDSVLE